MLGQLRRALVPIGIGVGLGVFAAGFLAYFVTGGGPVTTDGLGRVLVDSPWLMRLVFGQESEWPGWAWFGLDMVWFWAGLILAAGLVQAAGDARQANAPGWREKAEVAVAVVLALGTAYGTVRALKAGVALATGLGIGATPSFTGRIDHALVQLGEWRTVNDWLEAHADTLPPDAARRMGARGMLRLPLADQETRARLQLQLLRALEPAKCAALMRDGRADDLDGLLAQLGPASDTLAQLYARALVAEVRGRGTLPVVPASRQALDLALGDYVEVVGAALPPTDRSRFLQALEHPVAAGDADVCWVGQSLYRHALTTPDSAARQAALRLLIAVDGGGPGS